ncbi:MAG TPA: VOC family protein [Candidatus Limnocylindria bacterium]|nr:VOC family protein [Candidatus Limnocylindria bacterium]
MIEVYLNFPGNAAEAAAFYANAFQAGPPDLMTYDQMPPGVDDGIPEEMRGMVMHGNIRTFAGDLMLSDDTPAEDLKPNRAVWILVSHADHGKLRAVFSALSVGGEVLMPLEPTFFSPLYGQVADRYGFRWHFMDPTPMEGGPQ